MGCGSGCEIVGTIILSPGSGSSVYTKPMPRRGESAVVSLNVSQFSSGGAVFEVEVQTKNSDEAGWSAVGSISSISDTGLYSVEVSSLKQFLRLWLKFGVGTAAGDFAMIDGINVTPFPY